MSARVDAFSLSPPLSTLSLEVMSRTEYLLPGSTMLPWGPEIQSGGSMLRFEKYFRQKGEKVPILFSKRCFFRSKWAKNGQLCWFSIHEQ
jgi:hypothetical protein